MQATEWIYTRREFDASAVLKLGLIRSIHDPDELLPAAYALAVTFPMLIAVLWCDCVLGF